LPLSYNNRIVVAMPINLRTHKFTIILGFFQAPEEFILLQELVAHVDVTPHD